MKVNLVCALCLIFVLSAICVSAKPGNYTHQSRIPDRYNKYVGDSGIFVTVVFEYTDAVVIHKSLKQSKNMVYYLKNEYIVVNDGCFKGPEKAKWLAPYDKRDIIYDTGTIAGKKYSVSALTVINITNYRLRQLYFDTLLPEKSNNKPVILRYVHQVDFLESAMGSLIRMPLPEKASLIGSKTIRLEFKDGAVEYWNFVPDTKDVLANHSKYRKPNRNLLWWNKKGKGSFFCSPDPVSEYDSYKAWNYSDSAKEPVYK